VPAAAINRSARRWPAALCRRERRGKRLACFDSLVATLPKIEADQFGLTRDLALKRDPVAERHADTAVLPGAIVALGQTPRGQLIFTLDNQQVWIQTEVEQSKTFSVGDVVAHRARRDGHAMACRRSRAQNARQTNQLVHCVGAATTLPTCSPILTPTSVELR